MKFSVVAGLKAVVSGEEILLIHRNSQHTCRAVDFPWVDLFNRLSTPNTLSDACADLESAPAGLTRRVVLELIEAGLLVAESEHREVKDFHSSTFFGNFFEQAERQRHTPFRTAELTLAKRESPLSEELFRLLASRRTSRGFSPGELPWRAIATLLLLGYGSKPGGLGVVASAGSTRPIRFALWSRSVSGVASGLHSIDMSKVDPAVINSGLGAVVATDVEISELFLTTELKIGDSAATIFLLADITDICHRYGPRGYRYALLEAGAVAQSLSLACTALGIAHAPIGAFRDDRVAGILGGGNLLALHSLVLGLPK